MKDYIKMTTKNYRTPKTYLVRELDRLVRELNSFASDAAYGPPNHGPTDKKEEIAAQRMDFEIQLIKKKHLEKQIAEIEHALKKIEAGSYGYCDSCGLLISPARLEAIPQASYCINCKGKQRGQL